MAAEADQFRCRACGDSATTQPGGGAECAAGCSVSMLSLPVRYEFAAFCSRFN